MSKKKNNIGIDTVAEKDGKIVASFYEYSTLWASVKDIENRNSHKDYESWLSMISEAMEMFDKRYTNGQKDD